MYKLFVVGFLAFVLLIPLLSVYSLILEREDRRDQAVQEIDSSWALPQSVVGPMIDIPYQERWKDAEDRARIRTATATLLPEDLQIVGGVVSEVRRRGIFEAILFEANLELTGSFSRSQLENLVGVSDEVLWDKAVFAISITDARGISDNPRVVWAGKDLPMKPGGGVLFESGLHGFVNLADAPDRVPFSVNLKLRGSEQLMLAPLGNKTKCSLRSTWPDPGFTGSYLPRSRKIGPEGFQAEWEVLDFGRNFGQLLTYADDSPGASRDLLKHSLFGVRLVKSVDAYQQVTRSVKYGILFVGFTFLSFFLFEILRSLRVHTAHYLLVGLALCIFYLLLLSLAEHVGFPLAFLVSSVAVVTLITAYSFSFLRVRGASLILSAILVGLYGYLYVLLQIEDYALLAGSIGLFLALACVMWLTRSLDWEAALKGDRRPAARGVATTVAERRPPPKAQE